MGGAESTLIQYSPNREGVCELKVQSLLSLSEIAVKLGQRNLLSAVSFGVTNTSRIGLVGANGCGKSTLLKVIMGEIEPDKGEITKPKHVQIGYVQQFVPASEAKLSLYEYLSGRAEKGNRVQEWEAIATALELGLSDEQLAQSLDSLSGGQLNIALLAGALALGPDLLLMDEPTNGLDTEGIEAFGLPLVVRSKCHLSWLATIEPCLMG
jgi:ATPase subunit of ABC transporter with duplicated ATPase domains